MSTTTTWSDLSRRAATVFLVVLCLLTIPAIANAKFASPQAVSQSVGTDRMETPTNVLATYSCKRGSSTESITVTVLSFTDGGPSGSTYSYKLLRNSSVVDTAYSPWKLAQVGGSKSRDSAATTWTVTIQAVLSNWTSGTFTKSVTCPANGDRDGWL